ncbi:amidohydrolase [Reichenbachiella ulvae]|uniref:Amidohydrolase n=1 Tax=Reichenbachiella ulvae TaxID=2980104 RepID=A0ABT3CTQ3_9BACT|nr:amidohydrolase [Reichenbachiella ulvae]MCV9386999.1 amidohydrolase [Reichenbachiella ulvae]
MKKHLTLLLILSSAVITWAQPGNLSQQAQNQASQIEEKMIEWRHDLHQNPELSNREFNTARKIEKHLKSLGIEVQTGVAKTGVIGILKGGQPGPVIGLRADMDALPVTERVEIPWASQVTASYNGIESGVMHACGHDTHVAILMATAEVLNKMKKDLKGTVKFVFQPAEEGAPPGEEGGAQLMVKEGVLHHPDVDVMIGLHINASTPVGQIKYKSGGTMAAADRWVMKIKGKQSHGSRPWTSVDPIVTAAQIINGMQTVISRNAELTKEAAVLTVGLIRGGIRNNIIPEEVEMIGTIRTLDVDMQDKLHEDFRRVAINIGESMGATVELEITKQVPVTYNDPELTSTLVPFISDAIGAENVVIRKAMTGAEDFSYFANEVPSFFFFVGGCPKGTDPNEAAPHHTPDFYVDDAGMITGLQSMLAATLGYMYQE